jgi:hypothetical protein
MTRADQARLERQMPICYRPNDLSKLLELAGRHPSGRGEQVLRWHRSLTQAERLRSRNTSCSSAMSSNGPTAAN